MELQVVERRLGEGESCRLEARSRVVYDVDGDSAEFSSDGLTLEGPRHALCFELVPEAEDEAKLSAPVELEGEQLMRCDRVDFPPGGVAYLHTHQGPGIRVLLHGDIRIDTDGESHPYGPLEAWFEPGPVPVFAAASQTDPTAFVRCMILPAALQGKSSIRYVNDEDADKPKPQRYRVFVDEPLSLSVSL
jgi:quercetin dioxygenase-like cupin family protein